MLRGAGISVAEIAGDPDRTITGVAPLDWAGEGHITFCTTAGETGRDRVGALDASAVLCLPEIARGSGDPNRSNGPTRVAVANPRLAFAELCAAVYEPAPRAEIHPSAVIDTNASIGMDVSIGAGCVIGRCTIGDRVELRANVVVGDDVIIGARTRVFAGTVIGSDGFGYERDDDGAMIKLAHLGGVVIGADVEIGSNPSIDRGTLDDTVIGDRCKIDNLVHVAHNVRIDADAVVIAHARTDERHRRFFGSDRLDTRCPTSSVAEDR